MPLTAKYATTCGVCRMSIMPGEEIAKAGRGWGHLGCAGSGDGQEALIPVTAPEVAGTPAADAGPPAPSGAAAAAAGPAPAGALEVWTDGACSGNPGPGGWAWATKDGRQGSGGAPATTNQRMEIQAALSAVTELGGDGPLVVVSDSTYVVNCFRDGWWRGWLARGWVNSAKKPVANRDLWEPLIDLVRARDDIRFRWVKGHSGDPMNDLVDRLAVEAAARIAKPS